MISSLGVCSVVLGLTAHVGFKSDYNFVHPSYKCQSEKIMYGVYLNSEGSLSSFLGKEINSYIENKLTLDEATNLIVKKTKNFAKRQYTWFEKRFDDNLKIYGEDNLSLVVETFKKII